MEDGGAKKKLNYSKDDHPFIVLLTSLYETPGFRMANKLLRITLSGGSRSELSEEVNKNRKRNKEEGQRRTKEPIESEEKRKEERIEKP